MPATPASPTPAPTSTRVPTAAPGTVTISAAAGGAVAGIGPVAVTGAAGKLGRAVVADLVAAGYTVRAIDRVPITAPAAASSTAPERADRGGDDRGGDDRGGDDRGGDEQPRDEQAGDRRTGDVQTGDGQTGVEVWQVDGDDLAAMTTALRGCDALVALASVPQPGTMPPHKLFANNTTVPFVALQAAVGVGIERVALASSGSAYGTAWSPTPVTVDRVPVTEDHPMRNAEEYGLSKQVTEEIGEMFCRQVPGLSVAALRFHWVATAEEQRDRIAAQRRGPRSWPHELRELWGYVDVRDAARACRLALEAAAVQAYGFQAMNVVAADLLADETLPELLDAHAPQVRRGPDGPAAGGAFSIRRAAEVIGWVPEHSWRQLP